MPCWEHSNALKFNKYLAPFKIRFDQKIEVVVAKILGTAHNIPRKCVKLLTFFLHSHCFLMMLFQPSPTKCKTLLREQARPLEVLFLKPIRSLGHWRAKEDCVSVAAAIIKNQQRWRQTPRMIEQPYCQCRTQQGVFWQFAACVTSLIFKILA